MIRFLSVVICICLLASSCCAAESADEPGFLESLGSWLAQTWEEASAWASQAWKEARAWIDQAWGDSSEWIERAWNASSEWVKDIWGDVSAWAAEKAQSVSGSIRAWWEITFSKSSVIDEAWLSDDQDGEAFAGLREHLLAYKASLAAEGNPEAKVTVHDYTIHLLKELKLDDESIRRIYETVQAYAGSKGLSVDDVEAIMLPYLLQLTLDGITVGSVDHIPAVIAAQYLTGVFEKLGVHNDEDARLLAAKVSGIFDE